LNKKDKRISAVSETEPTTNRLIDELSPYLRQHAHNPVDWYPWGPAALQRAREEDKPIFLSIGYSACHWCHVMERECFENPGIAALMNEHFVSIKVDREERPDLDEIYMKAVTALTGAGGWPMSVFLTPQLEPFFGATYLPPVRAHGRPSFPDVLIGLSEAYKNERGKVVETAKQLTAAIADESRVDLRGELPPGVIESAIASFQRSFDPVWGGFGAAPKFPHAGDLRLCLRHHQHSGDAACLNMATRSLDAMADGGICDQLGGGFHRYSTDREWRVPHFEKMLYDNAQLIVAYLEAFTATGTARYAAVARDACAWALREMQLPEGGFASAQDADSEGEEGRFFAWTPAELETVLGAELGRVAASYFDVSAAGNFEAGKSVLWTPRSGAEVAAALGCEQAQLERDISEARRLLLVARERRVRPNTDDKVLCGWNGLIASALALAFQVLGDPRHLRAAERCLDFVLLHLRQPDGRLFGTARAGRAHVNAGLDDYAFVIEALLDLYEANFDPARVRQALELARLVEDRFADAAHGGYFNTSRDHEQLIARLKSTHDGALPSGAAVQAKNLARLAALTGDRSLRERAEATLSALGGLAPRYPQAFAHLFIAHDFLHGRPREVVIAGEPNETSTQALLASVRGVFRPQRVVLLGSRDADVTLLPTLRDKTAGASGARAYVCEEMQCLAPTEAPDELVKQLRA
jgi:uncharacterized protein YyaL (SSP411 family)